MILTIFIPKLKQKNMASEKKKKVKMKVKTTGKSIPAIDQSLNEMAGLFLVKPITGEMDYLLKKKDGEIVINEFTMSESLKAATGYNDLGSKIQESAQADLAGVKDGRIKVIFESEYEEIVD